MRQLCILLGMLLIQSLSAQTNYTVNGKVLDEAGEAVSWATVVLYTLEDTSLITGVYSDESGQFSIVTEQANCLLTASSVGMGKYSQTLQLTEPVTTLADFQLSNGVTLDQIEVKAKRLELTYQNGVLSYIPQNIFEDNSLDFLKTVPLLMTDRNENLLIKGNSAKVLINGKDLRISGEELKAYLRTLPPDRILKVEVITNPSAKYEADGSAGILNIVLKSIPKNFAGSIYSNVVYNERWSALAGGSFSYFADKFGVALSLRQSYNEGFNNLFVSKVPVGDANSKIQFTDQSDTETDWNLTSGKLSLNYFINQRNTLSGFFKGYRQRLDLGILGNTEIVDNSVPFTTTLNSDSDFNDQSFTAGLDYSLTLDSAGTVLNMEYLHLNADKENTTGQLTKFFEGNVENDDFGLQSVNDQSYRLHAAKLDLTYPISPKVVLETGLKYSNVLNQNNLEYIYNPSDQQYILTPIESNAYDYHENIYAFYLSGNLTFDNVILSLGNRIEYTVYESEVDKIDGIQRNDDDYLNFFPNIGITYVTPKGNAFSASYGRRLNRPSYRDLNPSILYVTQYIYSQGDPFLQPEYSNNFEITAKTGRLVTSLFANLIDQPLGEYILQNDENQSLLVVKNNLDESKTVGLLLSSGFDLSPKIGLQVSAIGQWQSSQLDDNTNDVYSANVNANLNYQVNKWLGLNWSTYYTSPFLYGLYKVDGQFINNAGISIKHHPWRFKLSVRDIFQSGFWDSEITSDAYITQWVNRWPTGVVTFSVSYRFGNGKVKSKGRYKGDGSTDETNRIN